MDEEKFQYKCDFCEKSFFNEEILGLHIKSNHKTIIGGCMKCEFCDKKYFLKNSLYVHVKMTHSNANLYECDTCNKKFLQKLGLQRHKNAIHEGNKTFQM